MHGFDETYVLITHGNPLILANFMGGFALLPVVDLSYSQSAWVLSLITGKALLAKRYFLI